MPTPLLPVVLCLAAGVLCGRSAWGSVALWSGLLIAGLACGWLFFGRRRNGPAAACVLAAAFFLGALRSQDAQSAYRNHPLRLLKLPEYADFEGQLFRSPSFGPGQSDLALRVDGFHYRKRFYRLNGRIRVFVLCGTPADVLFLKSLRPGDRIRVSARLSGSPGFRNFGPAGADRRHEILGFHRTAFSKSALLVTRAACGSKLDPRLWAAALRRRLLDKIEETFRDPGGEGPTEAGAVLEAILLGERGRLNEETLRSLRESGLFHLIAISGAHIAVFAGFLHVLLALIRIPRRPASLLLIVFLVFYALAVEGRASVLRAVLMAGLFLLGKVLWKDVRPLNSVSLSALILLLWRPASLLDPGFQLTFAATTSLILFMSRIRKRLPRLPLRLRELFAASLAAHLGVAPVLVSSFNRVVFSGLVLNLAAVPLMAAVMASGYVFLILAHIHPLSGQAAGWAAEILVRVFLFLSRLPGQTPPFSYRLPSPPAPVIGLYAVFLLALLLPRKRKGRSAAFLILFLSTFAVLSLHPFPPRHSPGLRLTVLDVGQGESILVEFPGRKKMLIDGGGLPGGNFDVGESVVSPFLWRAGMKRVDILVSTHAHSDHIEGLCAVARNFRVGEVWEAPSPSDDPWRRRFLRTLPAGVSVHSRTEGDSASVAGVRVEVLHPPGAEAGFRTVDNELSLVLRLTYGRVSMLLAADVGRETEHRLLRGGSSLESFVLKAGHHGSPTATSPEFLERVKPRLAVISCGAGNAYGLPGPAVLERLRRCGARIYRTDLDGAVEISTDGRTVEVRTAAEIDGRPVFAYIEEGR
ncbi:MAG: DNA internalization-related competence protein ComEC/Rec2 [Candidatus Aminicenantes bacterium]|nr:DNA internalization-related competence protein ComEC/Rec2 [Candidatus Aminicenantes bacterium]